MFVSVDEVSYDNNRCFLQYEVYYKGDDSGLFSTVSGITSVFQCQAAIFLSIREAEVGQGLLSENHFRDGKNENARRRRKTRWPLLSPALLHHRLISASERENTRSHLAWWGCGYFLPFSLLSLCFLFLFPKIFKTHCFLHHFLSNVIHSFLPIITASFDASSLFYCSILLFSIPPFPWSFRFLSSCLKLGERWGR